MIRLLLVVCIFFYAISNGYAEVIKVPGDQPTIQAGIDAASNGDTVLVAPSTYYENLIFRGKKITLGSHYLLSGDTTEISRTIINGNGAGCVITFKNREDSTTTITGFTITNGSGGIYCNDASPNMHHLIIANNIANYGGGIFCSNSNPLIKDIIITKNTAMNEGGGIFCNGSNPILKNVNICNNKSRYYGGGMSCRGGNIFISGAKIMRNTCTTYGGGIYIRDSKIAFDRQNRCNMYHNFAGTSGNDLYFHRYNISPTDIIDVVVDTFTVLIPTTYQAYLLDLFTFDIMHGKTEPVAADLYVSPDGNDLNSGLSASEPLKSIAVALNKSIPDSAHPHTVFLGRGIYSPSQNNELFPLNMRSYISLKGESQFNVTLDAEGQFGIMCFSNDEAILIENMVLTGSAITPAIDIYHYNPIFKNLLISFNDGALGGAVECLFAGPLFLNVTITENTAIKSYGGIYCYGARVKLVNSILWNNSPNEIYCSAGDFFSYVTIINSNIDGEKQKIKNGIIEWVSGNKNSDPMFINPSQNNFKLQKDSPCIDAGIQDTTILYFYNRDTLSIPALTYYGKAPDMGAFEFGDPARVAEKKNILQKFDLFQNYPNPFNSSTVIKYSLAENSEVSFKIYDVNGRLVDEIILTNQEQGEHEFRWTPQSLSSGVFLIKIQTQNWQKTIKAILLK